MNGEGIHATRPRPGTLWSEGENLRFTRSKDSRTLYLFATEWPGKTLVVKSMESNQAGSVHLLGYSRELARRWDTGQGLTITLPEDLQQESNRPCQFAWCFRIASAKTA